MKKDDRLTLLVIVIVCFICSVIIFFSSKKSNIDKLLLVDDYSTFFSVTSEVNNYISYSNNGNISNLLDNKYLELNSIIENKKYSALSELSDSEMQYVKIGDNYLYLVKGKIIENDFDTVNIIDDNFMVIVLNDLSSNSYSIYPIDNGNYEKIINSIKKISIPKNSDNKIIVSDNPDEVDICKLYFSEYVSKLLYDTISAYDDISDSMKKKYPDYESFNTFIRDNMNKISSSSKLCRRDVYKEKRIYTIIDNNENSYTFSENSVMNYKVDFYFNSKVE